MHFYFEHIILNGTWKKTKKLNLFSGRRSYIYCNNDFTRTMIRVVMKKKKKYFQRLYSYKTI